ncbi:bifunctional hydroxymethylpyrimidine kinase/phosphomethylpyrimidine kinase [Actinomyces haliotis]|uniref:bifunctional hydroxymethylpyrimidine kinase/phosphomethylpyrimidine kinase n=1 Tax=Actinomyces haliotis TaxID=1280843 RepID=UPI001E507BC1|nr:bifunctional hydroxymethylpyrimidine kinase/phosphomethylpyrimidine kinase [Actinomyces haliotis]
MIPRVLTIAGSDPSGGAGLQADLKSMSALGAYGMSVVTALTAQSTTGVTGVLNVPEDFVRAQLDTLLDDVAPDATKIGMLSTTGLIGVVSEYLPRLGSTVLDPVMVATSGDRLLEEEAVQALRELCTRADLITPNMPEAAVLLDEAEAVDVDGMVDQARALLDLGIPRALLKGGHLAGEATDVYADADGVELLTAPRTETRNTHGTGCTLSSAIAALRPRRAVWLEAVRDAKTYLASAIAHADELAVGHGHGPVHHFHALWDQHLDEQPGDPRQS